jgi:hypothetical protein
MKKKLNTLPKLIFTIASSIVFLSYLSDPPNGYTGAPPSFNTCSNCHSGGTGTGSISITGLPATITPNTQYPISVTISRTNSVPQLGGFQMVVQNEMNQNSGTLSNPQPVPNAALDTEGGKTYFEHANALAFGGNNSITYTVDWTSPASGTGNITMYAAGNLANGNGGTSGDKIVTATVFGTFMGGGGAILVDITGTDVSCLGGNNGSASASASGGGGAPYTYNWSNGANGPNINNLTAGVYTVTVSNVSGSTGSSSVTIGQPATSVSVSIINQINIDCQNPVGSATAQGNGGTPGYTYNWTGGGSGQTVALPPGNFTVTVTDANGCTSAVSGNITSNTAPPNAEAGPPGVVSCANPTTSLNGTGSSAGANFSYQWTTTDGNILSGATTLSPVVNQAGTYTLTVTNNQNFCTATDLTTVVGSTATPEAEAGPGMTLTCSSASTTLNGTGSSTGGNFAYAWTTANGNIVSGANTLMPVVDAVGTYTLTVTNTSHGCTKTDQTTVSSNTAAPTSAAGSDMVLTCATTSLQLNGNNSSAGANFSYQWSTASGNIVAGANTLTPTVDEPGTYCLLVTNTSNGCTASDCANVSENTAAPIANAGSAPPLTCATTSVTLNGSASSSGPNFSYLWTTTNGNIVSGGTTTMPVVDAAGIYTIRVTNSDNGCTATSNVTVNANTAAPTAEAGPNMALNCNNSSVVLNGSNSSQGGNFSYQWSGPGIVSGGNTANPTVDTAGTYTIIVTNNNTGCTATDNTAVSQTPVLNAAISNSINVGCNGNSTGSATAQGNGGSGAYTYNWSNGANTQQATNLAAGNYTVTIIDADNCTATATASISEPAELIANASATGESAGGANDGAATANPTGGVPAYAYLWSNGQTAQAITGLAAGSYTVTVSDANGCSTVESVTVASFNCASFGINLSSSNPSCNGSTDGEATANPVSGTGPFSYIWSNGSTSNTASNLGAGTYNVTITDENACEITGNVTLTAPAALNLTISQQTNVLCNGQANGSATVVAAGGTPAYTYTWPGGTTGASQSGLAAGNYAVTATDANACTNTIQVNISQPPLLNGNVAATAETAVGANDGTASVAAAGGFSPYQYNWSNGAVTPAINNLSPAEYCVTVTDANGCTFTGCATVNQFGCVGQSVLISSENISCFGLENGMATIETTGFADPVAIEWSNGSTGATIGNLAAAVYTVSVTDANGCAAIETVEIAQPDLLVVNIASQTNLECAGAMTGSVTVEATGGTPNYSYSWPNGATNATIGNLPAGNYEVSVSDQNNCLATLNIEIGIDPDTEPPTVVAQNISIALDANGQALLMAAMLDAGSTDNCGIASFLVDMANFDCSHIGENPVSLTATDAAGNSASATAMITVLDDIPPTIVCPDNITVVADNCEANVDYDGPLATDNCQNITLSILSGAASGELFSSGTTEVLWMADDNHGNTATCAFTVTVQSDFSATTLFTAPSCADAADGSATANPTNGTPPFTYEWNDPANQTAQTATGLAAGEYEVLITDAEGCATSASVEVSAPEPVTVTLDQVVNETGNSMDGAIKVTIFGGTGAPYTYAWLLNGEVVSTEEDPTGLAAGEYILTVTDQNGCSTTLSVTVDQASAAGHVDLGRSINIFPVPTAGHLFVAVDFSKMTAVQIDVLDLTGRLVLPPANEVVAQKDFVFDLSEKAAGVYLVRIVAEKEVLFKRIILSR